MKPPANEKHEAHQAMLQEHKERKELARVRHRTGWHRFKPIPIILV